MNSNSTIILSIVVPVFSEETNINHAISRIMNNVNSLNISYEIIFVDDGSTDQTWEMITKAGQIHSQVKGLRFSRNFGKENALFAGLSYAQGKAVITIDGDMQHPPELISDMYSCWENDGFEIIDVAKKSRPKESFFYKLNSIIFYSLFKKLTNLEIFNSTDYKLLDRKVVDSILRLPEKQRFYRGLTSWVGFKHKTIKVNMPDRVSGRTKWNILTLINYATNNIFNFTAKPLLLIGFLGLFFLILSFVLSIISFVRVIMHSTKEGFPTIILLVLLVGGIIIFSQFLIGIYISKLFEEVKDRPSYIVKDKVNF